MRTVSIGALTISLQAFLVLISGTVFAAVTLIAKPSLWYISLGVLLMSFVQAYSINCIVVGNCHIWAWITAVMAVVVVTLYYIPFFLKSQSLRK